MRQLIALEDIACPLIKVPASQPYADFAGGYLQQADTDV